MDVIVVCPNCGNTEEVPLREDQTVGAWPCNNECKGDDSPLMMRPIALVELLKAEMLKGRDPNIEEKKFVSWWKENPDRALCTLAQAIGAYLSTFPGRIHSLLVELLGKHA